jgi:hypothetical protein
MHFPAFQRISRENRIEMENICQADYFEIPVWANSINLL